MNRYISSLIQQGGLKLLDKKPLAPNFVEWSIQELVSTRRHTQKLDGELRVKYSQPIGYMICLPQGQRALAGRDN
jgi:hypothetical protein